MERRRARGARGAPGRWRTGGHRVGPDRGRGAGPAPRAHAGRARGARPVRRGDRAGGRPGGRPRAPHPSARTRRGRRGLLMRLDVLSIFPDYLAPLDLSLIGRAREKGLLELTVHDLRDWTHDRHRTVDDTPYGGGAGMVMKPEPWGEALDALLGGEGASAAVPPAAQAPGDGGAPVLVVPSPAGEVFSQAMARELASRQHLVFACGRYEGIDQRVSDWAA